MRDCPFQPEVRISGHFLFLTEYIYSDSITGKFNYEAMIRIVVVGLTPREPGRVGTGSGTMMNASWERWF